MSIWLHRVKRKLPNGKPWHPTEHDMLCSDHFSAECFEVRWGKTYLRERLAIIVWGLPKSFKACKINTKQRTKFEFLLYLFHYSKTDVELLLKYDCCETILILYHTCILLQAVVKQTIARFKHASSIEKGMLYSVYQSLPNNMLLSSPLLLILQ